MQFFSENMKWIFGLQKNKIVVNNKTDGPGLLTEALCMATREENCTAFLLTTMLWEKLLTPLPQPIGLFHASSNLSHTD